MKDILDIKENTFVMPATEMCESGNCLNSLPLAYAYVPYQVFSETYDCKKALERGTAFPELDKPIDVYGFEFCKTNGGMTDE